MKPRFKLVRDRLPQHPEIVERPAAVMGEHEVMNLLLLGKLHEEATEIASAGFKDVSEYADLFQVMLDLARRNGVSWRQIEEAFLAKWRERGGFTLGRVMVEDHRGDET